MKTRTRVAASQKDKRDNAIYEDYKNNMSARDIAHKYFLTLGNTQLIIRNMIKKYEQPVQEEIKIPVKKEYRVIEADTIEELVRGVNEMMEQGYTPVGSISNVSTMSRHYVQAIMK